MLVALWPVALYIFWNSSGINLSTCPSKLFGPRAGMNHMVRTKILNRKSSMIRAFKEGVVCWRMDYHPSRGHRNPPPTASGPNRHLNTLQSTVQSSSVYAWLSHNV
ncbi:hypothetical protein EDB92DRAFT_1861000, partial [Lactarius akahatsu]